MAAVVLVPAVAYADVDGGKGSVASVSVNDTKADNYGAERGSVVINESDTVTRKYQWGGAACNGKNLSEANVALLVEALRAHEKMELVPSYKDGAGQARCLVGFRLQRISKKGPR